MHFRSVIRSALFFLFMTSSKTFGIDPEVYSEDLYRRLGMYPSCSMQELMDSAEKLMSLYHHQMKRGGTETAFNSIKVAYETLSDPIKRKAYDEQRQIKIIGYEDRFTPVANAVQRREKFINEHPVAIKANRAKMSLNSPTTSQSTNAIDRCANLVRQTIKALRSILKRSE